MKNPWIRILLFLLSSLGIMIAVVLMIAIIDRDFVVKKAESRNPVLDLVYYFLAFASVAASVVLFNERENWRRLLLSFSIKEFLLGCFLALVALAPVILCLVSSQAIQIQPQPNTIFLIQLVSFMLVAMTEEVLCRGFILETLKAKYSPRVAIVASSLIFALLHIFNDHLTIVGMVNLTLSGIIFSLLYFRSGNLSAAIGMHFFWNVFQGPVAGFSVSGNVGDSFFKIEYLTGSGIITGGGFGLEGSILLVLSQALCCVYLFRERQLSFVLRGMRPGDVS
jgi:uncharacterized protein